MEGVHLVNVTSTIVKQQKEIEACKMELTILLDECLRYVRKYIFYSWSNSNNFEMVDGGINVLNKGA